MERYLEVEIRESGNDFLIYIKTQTHRGDNFYVDNADVVFTSSDGFELISSSFPEARPKDDRLFVRGDDPDRDKDVIIVYDKDDPINKEYIWKLRLAVNEYNLSSNPYRKISIKKIKRK